MEVPDNTAASSISRRRTAGSPFSPSIAIHQASALGRSKRRVLRGDNQDGWRIASYKNAPESPVRCLTQNAPEALCRSVPFASALHAGWRCRGKDSSPGSRR
jgi:hypothetical protein